MEVNLGEDRRVSNRDSLSMLSDQRLPKDFAHVMPGILLKKSKPLSELQKCILGGHQQGLNVLIGCFVVGLSCHTLFNLSNFLMQELTSVFILSFPVQRQYLTIIFTPIFILFHHQMQELTSSFIIASLCCLTQQGRSSEGSVCAWPDRGESRIEQFDS